MARDVSFHSRLTYDAQPAAITSVCAFDEGGAGDAQYSFPVGGVGGIGSGAGASLQGQRQGSAGEYNGSSGSSVASASSNGTIHMWRPELVAARGGARIAGEARKEYFLLLSACAEINWIVVW